MDKNKSVTISWFEIPVIEMNRAKTFYEKVFDAKLHLQDIVDLKMAFFPWDENSRGAGGALIEAGDHYKPSHEGCQIYFACEDVAVILKQVEKAGGEVLQEKTEINPEHGYMGLFEDSEGNRIALHSEK